ncbi:MAG TPA: hypothetical protein VEI97_14885 [bacterium]|nr:hypothetical protein [bacterium]
MSSAPGSGSPWERPYAPSAVTVEANPADDGDPGSPPWQEHLWEFLALFVFFHFFGWWAFLWLLGIPFHPFTRYQWRHRLSRRW